MYTEINDYVSNLCGFDTQELANFNRLLEYKEIKRKTFLLRPGDISNYEFFIKKGCIRLFYVNPLGAEVVLNFGVENWWIGDISSFTSQTPSRFFIETIEKCDVFMLSYENKKKLLLEIPKFERVFRLMLESNVVSSQNRLIQTITSQARERYLDFIKKYPSLPNRVTQLQIASYLGITPEFLSKMKHELIDERII